MKPVTATDLQIGQSLPWPVVDQAGKVLLNQGTLIATQAQMQLLLSRGFIFDPEAAEAAGDPVDPFEADGDPQAIAVVQGMRALRQRLDDLHFQLLNRTARGFTRRMKGLAARLDALAERDPDAALAAMQLDVPEQNLPARLVHAALMCRMVARALDLPDEERLSIVCAALTYDVALSPIIDDLITKQGPLTPEEEARVRVHPEEGVELLRAAGVRDEVWLDAVLQHHERIDGSGYHRQLRGEAISLPARIVAIADMFTAMIRPRAYRDAINSRQALRHLFLERGKAVDETLAALFVKESGLYPPGSLVRLANGEVAVVWRRGQATNRPRIRCVLGRDGGLDFDYPERDPSAPASAIVEAVDACRYRSVLPTIARLWD